MSKTADRALPAYWSRRLFHASFTYQGRRRVVPGWCIKVQVDGRRRTVRLRSSHPQVAAREAAALYAALCNGGWTALETTRISSGSTTAGLSGVTSSPVVPWVGPRKYVSDLNPGFSRELLATLTSRGETHHVPLGTEDEDEGRRRARRLDAELQREGWPRLRLTHPREVTVAVFWQANPMTCTYTTLLTQVASDARAAPLPAPTRGWRVLIIEADGGIRRALAHWLRQGSRLACVGGCPVASEVTPGAAWDLILANRDQPAASLRRLVSHARGASPRLLTHGVFADSDAIFGSFSGVSQGYLLRRVPPISLLAPLLTAFPDEPPRSAEEADRPIRRYFQALFEPLKPPAHGTGGGVTTRELEILELLSRGFADKEIAGELGISAWTVHSHLKRIFTKYGVRTRTEAVVKHLQK